LSARCLGKLLKSHGNQEIFGHLLKYMQRAGEFTLFVDLGLSLAHYEESLKEQRMCIRFSYVVVLFLISISCTHLDKGGPMGLEEKDSYLWLEEVEGKKALDWVRTQNKRSAKQLESDPNFKKYYDKASKLYTDKDKLAFGSFRGDYIYNFWQDTEHVRGQWRRAKISDYVNSTPNWELILSFDHLAKSEKENWVFKGVSCLPSDHNRCLLSLSRGGKDAVVIREFDISTKAFVPDGFQLEEAKGRIQWINKDLVTVSTDFGKDSLSDAGYPRIVKSWRRGTPLSEAKQFFKSGKTHFTPYLWYLEDKDLLLLFDIETFSAQKTYVVDYKKDWSLKEIPIPKNVLIDNVFKSKIIVKLLIDWRVQNETFKEGSVVEFSLKDFVKTYKLPKVRTLFNPEKHQSYQSINVSKDAVYISLLNDVKGEIIKFTLKDNNWSKEKVNLPHSGSTYVLSSDRKTNHVTFVYEGFQTPETVYYSGNNGPDLRIIRQQKSYFDIKGMTVNQFFAVSKDGTKIPYFVVGNQDKVDGKNRTYMTGYGGFLISSKPYYNKSMGKLWLEEGGLFVVANIRGGNEYGPDWHKQALKGNRFKSYEDFEAVTLDLFKRKITSPEYLGIYGGSNGGLLMGAAYTMFPQHYGAIICTVPLLDMLRFHKLLAGASWMSEYGDPDIPAEREYLRKISPYHNVKAERVYPKIFISTSTKDDRVHPGHARKMAAKIEELGYAYLYYENIDGGHAGSANLNEFAHTDGQKFTFLSQQLKSREASKVK
jgi:prolyl oligopeptidase